MNGVDAEDRIEARVRKRQVLHGPQMQPPDGSRLAMCQRIGRDIQAKGLEPRTRDHQIFDKETLGAADVERAHARLQVKPADDIASHGHPAAIITIPAVTVFTRTIEIHLAELFGGRHNGGILAVAARRDITLCLGKGTKKIELRHCATLRLAGLSLCRPTRPYS